MITIIYDEKGKDMSLQTSGHAGYAPKGQDIVCAAVSTLMQSLAYSVGSGASLNMTPRITSSTIKTPSATKYAILVLFFSIMRFTSS